MFQRLKGLESDEIRRKKNESIDKKFKQKQLYHTQTHSKCSVKHWQPAFIVVLGQETTESSSGNEKESQQYKGFMETATKIEQAAVNVRPQTSQVCLSLLQ